MTKIKGLTILFLVFLIIGFISQVHANNGLIMWYRFDEGSGTNAYDSSGNGYNGTIINGTWTTGRYGNAIWFNSSLTTSWITVPNLNLAGTWTFAAWIYVEDYPTYRAIMGYDYAHCLLASAATYEMRYGTYYNSIGYCPYRSWAFIVYKFDGTNGSFYINGMYDSSFSPSGGQPWCSPFYIGATTYYRFNGIIDEVQFYSYGLSDYQIRTLYATGQITVAPTDIISILFFGSANFIGLIILLILVFGLCAIHKYGFLPAFIVSTLLGLYYLQNYPELAWNGIILICMCPLIVLTGLMRNKR